MSQPLQRLGTFIAAHAGMRMPDWVLEARVKERAAALGLPSAADYASHVMSVEGAAELALLVETLRVGETRFFRHAAQMKALTEEVIPSLRRDAGAKRVRAWSAGCATGEEAYTLAMLLHRALSATPVACHVLATDLSEEALAVARRGVYADAALEQVPASLRSHSFVRTRQGWTIAESVSKLVTFERHNLASEQYPHGFDLILCRNVLIYFEPDARRQVLERLIGSLRPGGFLFVGYAESLRDVPALEVVRTRDGVLFRKPHRPAEPAPTPRVPRSSALVKAAPAKLETRAPAAIVRRPRPPAPPAATATAIVSLHGSYADAVRLSTELSAAIAGQHQSVEVHLDGADYLCDEAIAVIRRARSAARSAGIEVTLVAKRPGIRRWMTRGGLSDPDRGEQP